MSKKQSVLKTRTCIVCHREIKPDERAFPMYSIHYRGSSTLDQRQRKYYRCESCELENTLKVSELDRLHNEYMREYRKKKVS